MTRPQFSKRTSRPREHLAAAAQVYPHAWAQADRFRASRGRDGVPDWPAWCYLPLAAWYAIVSEGGALPPSRALDVGRLGALGTWRMTQGIYRYDPALYDAVRATPVDGDVPHEMLYYLPEWCVYVETPGLTLGAAPLHGAFAHLESDANDGRAELRLLLDAESALLPVPLHLGPWPLAESLARMAREAQAQALRRGTPVTIDPAPLRPVVEPIVSLVLYLCSEAAEIGTGARRPGNPEPVRTRRHGWRLFPADGPRTWDVGVRLGAALRAAYHARETVPATGLGASPRPHVRRAHWHTYLTGAGRSERVLRWLPPIAVNVPGPDALPAVVRKVPDAP